MKLPESLRRPDWLKELQALLLLALVVVAVIGTFGMRGVVQGGELPVEARATDVSGTLDHQLRGGVSLADVQYLAVTVTEPSLAQRITWVLQSAPTYAVVLALLALLLRTVWLARRDDPFTAATVRRLRVLAVVALAGGWLGFMVETIAEMHLSSTVFTNGVAVSVQPPLYWFPIGFGLLAVAEVVRRGCALREDLAGVV